MPFGISSAGYIFTKVLRHVVEFWRSKGYRVILFLDDGLAASNNMHGAKLMSNDLKNDLLEFGFLIAEEKSDWEPKPIVTWLGHVFNFKTGTVYITDDRVKNIQEGVSYFKSNFSR